MSTKVSARRPWASLVSGALTVAAILGTAPSYAQGSTAWDPVGLVCDQNRRIILIHGTDSTGEFATLEIVRGLDPSRPAPDIFGADYLNSEFKYLLDGAVDTCLLTFSYDDIYLAENGISKRGINAWNVSTSPWEREPDELADYLQQLMEVYPPPITFDIIAYSAGGIVPTYWAAREQTTDAARRRVHSIIVIDGIVSGVDFAADLACLLPKSLRNAQISTYGRFPCQLGHGSPFTRTIRTTDWWTKIRLATVRAKGDLIVWHRFAGLPGKTAADPALLAAYCPPGEWFSGFVDCLLLTHGSVLTNVEAIEAIAETIALPP